jgi:hypothetical protein
MYITKQEFEKLQTDEGLETINKVLERAVNVAIDRQIKRLPMIVMAMLSNSKARQQIAEDFYTRNPEFKEHNDIVKEVVLKVEVDNPEKDYGEVLALAEPIITERIENVTRAKKLPIDKPTEVNLSGHGVIE